METRIFLLAALLVCGHCFPRTQRPMSAKSHPMLASVFSVANSVKDINQGSDFPVGHPVNFPLHGNFRPVIPKVSSFDISDGKKLPQEAPGGNNSDQGSIVSNLVDMQCTLCRRSQNIECIRRFCLNDVIDPAKNVLPDTVFPMEFNPSIPPRNIGIPQKNGVLHQGGTISPTPNTPSLGDRFGIQDSQFVPRLEPAMPTGDIQTGFIPPVLAKGVMPETSVRPAPVHRPIEKVPTVPVNQMPLVPANPPFPVPNGQPLLQPGQHSQHIPVGNIQRTHPVANEIPSVSGLQSPTPIEQHVPVLSEILEPTLLSSEGPVQPSISMDPVAPVFSNIQDPISHRLPTHPGVIQGLDLVQNTLVDHPFKSIPGSDSMFETHIDKLHPVKLDMPPNQGIVPVSGHAIQRNPLIEPVGQLISQSQIIPQNQNIQPNVIEPFVGNSLPLVPANRGTPAVRPTIPSANDVFGNIETAQRPRPAGPSVPIAGDVFGTPPAPQDASNQNTLVLKQHQNGQNKVGIILGGNQLHDGSLSLLETSGQRPDLMPASGLPTGGSMQNMGTHAQVPRAQTNSFGLLGSAHGSHNLQSVPTSQHTTNDAQRVNILPAGLVNSNSGQPGNSLPQLVSNTGPMLGHATGSGSQESLNGFPAGFVEAILSTTTPHPTMDPIRKAELQAWGSQLIGDLRL